VESTIEWDRTYVRLCVLYSVVYNTSMSTTHDVVNMSQDTTGPRYVSCGVGAVWCVLKCVWVQVLGPRSGIGDHGFNACYTAPSYFFAGLSKNQLCQTLTD
jgi:hypothetical protein